MEEREIAILFTVLVFAAIAAGFGWQFYRELSEWNRVRAKFFPHIQGSVLGKYKKSISRLGKLDFEGSKGKVSVTGAGFLLEMTNPLMEEFFIPFDQVTNVRRSSLLGQHFVHVDCGRDSGEKWSLVALSLPGESWDVLAPYIDPQLVKQGTNLNSVGEIVNFTRNIIAASKNKPNNLDQNK
jgi:hypothetical protein